jgi:hypothetical protein
MSGDNDLAKMQGLPKEVLKSVRVAIESIVYVRVKAESRKKSKISVKRR